MMLLAAGCLSRSPSNASDPALRERFKADREDFERLKDTLLVNPKVMQIRIDDEPTPADLQRTLGLEPVWGELALGALKATGAQAVVRDGDGVEIWMRLSGIIPSGSTKSVVWSPSSRAPLVDDTEHVGGFKGRQYSQLAAEWYLSFEWN